MMSQTLQWLKVGAILRSDDGRYLRDHKKYHGIRCVYVPESKCE